MAQKFRFTRSWEDLGARWEPGDIIYLSDTRKQLIEWRDIRMQICADMDSGLFHYLI